ncbi:MULTISPECIES: chromosomal replication initiator protein DnaA [Streptomyces]|uniref:Integral membrane protein n=1 Tax=Streptomyces clavifer TaxID=68188 RepID=A0ABS4V824_9ACTN|nr:MULTISPECIES: hypothetical protein [Streptomyces]MBP2359844.1 hypothetical protein [Streptomyces clavifer]MDX2746609.1 hypothetical protein [Streptomyces sp. NRRL_B-2557]GHB16461.1 membrane protein [Streptomyces clavifer]
MGIESDQLVYDYLSRIGDLAQRQQLSSGARMRLVATVRGEIDRQRGTNGSDSPAVVRRILGRLGPPDELVAAAAESGDGEAGPPAPRAEPDAAPAKPRAVPRPRRGVLRKDALRKRASDGGAAREPDGGATREETGERSGGEGPVPGWPSASAPHMVGLDEAGPPSGEPEWWRIEPGPFGEGDPGTAVPGFVGGLESPELLRPRRPVVEAETEPPADPGAEEEAAPAPGSAAGSGRRKRLRLRRRRPVGAAPAPAVVAGKPALGNPFLLLAAALLVAGAVLGSWIALAAGWLLAYSSRRISRAEAKWIAMGLPGVVVAGAFVWLWGRTTGRWGSPLAEGAMGDAMTEAWPVVLRTAAVASAVYLVWRARHLRG